MGWASYIPILAGLATFTWIGTAPSWRRTLILGAAGLFLGAAVDTAYPYLIGMSATRLQRDVVVPLVGPYGLSFLAVTLLPVAILAAMIIARRTVFRPRSPKNLRN